MPFHIARVCGDERKPVVVHARTVKHVPLTSLSLPSSSTPERPLEKVEHSYAISDSRPLLSNCTTTLHLVRFNQILVHVLIVIGTLEVNLMLTVYHFVIYVRSAKLQKFKAVYW